MLADGIIILWFYSCLAFSFRHQLLSHYLSINPNENVPKLIYLNFLEDLHVSP